MTKNQGGDQFRQTTGIQQGTEDWSEKQKVWWKASYNESLRPPRPHTLLPIDLGRIVDVEDFAL
ncbi:hypothetical protein [Persicobacter diffluens]|uniref:hypothetical protein n=1 Tax=Persicobacter diffluens TaxID=981 RepID=UPI0030C76A27